MTIRQRVRRTGFTIIEVVVFVALFVSSVVLIFASVNYASLGLKNAQFKTMAAHNSEELTEWLKYQAESQGYQYLLTLASVGGSTYCFNAATIAWPTVGSCTTYSLGNFFKREMVFQKTADNSQITATVTTYWYSVGYIRNSQIVTFLTNR
jgi:hypothetical protein